MSLTHPKTSCMLYLKPMIIAQTASPRMQYRMNKTVAIYIVVKWFPIFLVSHVNDVSCYTAFLTSFELFFHRINLQ